MIQMKASGEQVFSQFLGLLDADASLCSTPVCLSVSQLVSLSRLSQRGAFASPPSWMGLFIHQRPPPPPLSTFLDFSVIFLGKFRPILALFSPF